ncbi:LacI family DNA-binding transcriptional regulator [Protaetiibacter mangrovi]|uniref:LacI family transcriptional regulator n=1 Tax=Protaetiibacter mangrovi TaxID=2970926 RepID=A0ABT1ZHV4_9MICO|nr:LacI family DNA-binding transcriptional regulator [Protaetiibacter mangrovi]MCS0500298.1 LacI family transcriptional regulator [Protaetiibacter mangrovi]
MAERTRNPSMHDVAALAGVSHITVSRVLNDYPSIRPETRERVRAAIAELGYRRNLAARALVTSRTRAIGVLSPEVAQHGPASSVLAVERAARERGYHPLVTAAAVEHDATVAALGFLLDQAVEALVVIAPHETVLAAIRDLDIRVPLVTLQAPQRPGGIGVDQAEGSRLATRHLLDLGHTRIQHLAGPDGYLEASARRDGFAGAMADAGATPGAELAGDWSAASGFAAAALLEADTTAVVAANDQMAIGLIAALTDAGRRVPEEVSVVGFDDVPEAAYVRPALTTVHQDFELVGRRAVEELLARLAPEGAAAAAPAAAASAVIPPRLVVRASTAAPR